MRRSSSCCGRCPAPRCGPPCAHSRDHGAECSRGKSERVNAIFLADKGRRVLPATLGRTTMSPVELGWTPGVTFKQLVEMMVDADLESVESRKPAATRASAG